MNGVPVTATVSMLLMAGALSAQAPPPDGADAPRFTATYRVYQVGDDGARTADGWWQSSAGPAELAGEALIRHTWTLHFPGATVTDERLVTRDDMAPFLRFLRSAQGHHIVDFSGDSVRWTHVPLGGPPAEARTLAPRDDAVALSPLIWATLDLSPGDTTSVEVLDTDPPEPGTRVTATFTAEARETVRDETGRSWDALRVTRTLGVGGQTVGPPFTLWVVAEPPYEVRRAVGSRVWELSSFVAHPH